MPQATKPGMAAVATPSAPAAAVEAVYRKVTRRLIPFLFFCYVCAYLDRVNIGFARLQMLADLGFSETIYGLGAGIFFLGYFVFEVPSNLALHRFGARRWLTRIMLTWSLVSAGMMLVNSASSFYFCRFLLGVAEAGFFPGVVLYLTYWYPASRRGSVMALFLTGIPLAGIIGGPLSGWILSSCDGALGLAGWRWLFLLEALPSMALGIATLFYLDDGIAPARWLTAEEKRLLEREVAADAGQAAVHTAWGSVRDGRVWLLSAAYFGIVMALYGVGFWLPAFIRAASVHSPLIIGLLSAVPYAASAVAMVLVGRSADRRNERRWHVALPALFGATGLAASTLYTHNATLIVACMSVATMGTLAALGQFWSLPPAFLRGFGAAAGIALINSIGNLAGFLSPSLMGWISDRQHSSAPGVALVAVFLVAGGTLALALRPEAARDGSEPLKR